MVILSTNIHSNENSLTYILTPPFFLQTLHLPVGKQLRRSLNVNVSNSLHNKNLTSARIFTTDVGLRPAEPCSVSVAATQQLLTNIFSHICIVILSNPHFRDVS